VDAAVALTPVQAYSSAALAGAKGEALVNLSPVTAVCEAGSMSVFSPDATVGLAPVSAVAIAASMGASAPQPGRTVLWRMRFHFRP
jgi:hypothetical protein